MASPWTMHRFRTALEGSGAMGRRPPRRERSANSFPAPKKGSIATATRSAPMPPSHCAPPTRKRSAWSLASTGTISKAVVVPTVAA